MSDFRFAIQDHVWVPQGAASHFPKPVNVLALSTSIHLLAGVTTKRAGGRKLSELVADHVFRYVDGDELFAIMNGKRMPDELWRNHRVAAPRLDDFLFPDLLSSSTLRCSL